MKKIIVLLTAFLLLALWVSFYELGDQKAGSASPSAGSLLKLENGERLEAIDIRGRQNESACSLSRDGKDWRLGNPAGSLADRGTVSQFISALRDARREASLAKPESLAEFGLDPPALTIGIETDRKEGTLHVLLGRPDYTGVNVYARLASEPDQVFLTSRRLLTLAGAPADEWRSRKVLPFEAGAVTAIEIHREGGEKLRLELDSGTRHWQIMEPVREEADADAVERFLSQLQEARLARFAEVSSLSQAGLETPRLLVSLEGTDVTCRELRIGKASGDGFYAGRSCDPSVFVIEATLLPELDRELSYFQGKRVVRVTESDVTRVRMVHSDQTLLMERQDEHGFRVEIPESHTGQVIPTDRLWSAIRDLRLVPERTGHAHPISPGHQDLVLEIETRQGETLRYVFTREGEDVFLRESQHGLRGEVDSAALKRLTSEMTQLLGKTGADSQPAGGMKPLQRPTTSGHVL